MARERKIRGVSGFIMVLLTLFGMSSVAEAEETAFFVQPIIPDNQLEGTVDYFNIGTPAKIDQTLQLVVTNESSDPKKFAIKLLDGMTTDEGSVSYDTKHVYDKSAKYKFSEFGSIPDTLEVAGNESKTIDLKVKGETEAFIGLILGAVNVSEVKEVDTSKGGVGNTIAYNIPVKIRVAQEKLTSELKYQGMKLSNENHQYTIKMTFQNPIAEVVRDLALNYEITRKGQKKVLVTEEKKESELAPTSLYTPSLSLQDKQLKAGDYILTIKATSTEINEEWQSEFSITKKEAEQLNDGFEIENNGFNWLLWGLVALGIILVSEGGYYVYRKKKVNAEPKRKSITTHRK